MVPQKRAFFGDHFGGGNYSRTLSWGMKPSSIVIWSLKFGGFNSIKKMEVGVGFLVIWLTTWDFTNNWHFFYQWNLPQEWCQWDRGSVQREPGLSENWHVPEFAMIYDKSIQSFVCQGYLVFRRTDIVDWNRSKSWDLANSQQKKRGQMSNRIDIWYIYIYMHIIYICVCVFVYLFIYLFICLYIYIILYMYICINPIPSNSPSISRND